MDLSDQPDQPRQQPQLQLGESLQQHDSSNVHQQQQDLYQHHAPPEQQQHNMQDQQQLHHQADGTQQQQQQQQQQTDYQQLADGYQQQQPPADGAEEQQQQPVDPQQLQADFMQQQQQQLQEDFMQQQQQADGQQPEQADPDFMQQQQQVWYQLDARGKIDNYDEDDWFVPEQVPFKRRQNVHSTMVASRPHPWKRVRHHITAEQYHLLPVDTPTYVSLEAPPPLYPPKRFCDITGCEAPYVDPKTHLRYANAEAFKIGRSLTNEEVQARLGIRNAQSVLK